MKIVRVVIDFDQWNFEKLIAELVNSGYIVQQSNMTSDERFYALLIKDDWQANHESYIRFLRESHERYINDAKECGYEVDEWGEIIFDIDDEEEEEDYEDE